MEMPTGSLLGRAAGLKDRRALLDWQTGKLEVLERRRGNCGNFGPFGQVVHRDATMFAKRAIGRVVGELKREKLQGKLVENGIGWASRCRVITSVRHEKGIEQSLGEP